MTKWKTTKNHWSKTSKRDEVLKKVIVPLKNNRYDGTGIPRTKKTKKKISKAKKGVSIWNGKRDNVDWLIGNTNGFKKNQIPWNKGLKGYMAGEKNGRWKGGISTENEKARRNNNMRLWRKSVFERDNFTCQKYKISGGILNAHHINNFSEYPELRSSIENGITLSEKAHKEFHKIYGRKNNTKEQLIEFLQSLGDKY